MPELIQGSVDTYYNSDFAEVKRENDAARHNTQGIAYGKNSEHARNRSLQQGGKAGSAFCRGTLQSRTRS